MAETTVMLRLTILAMILYPIIVYGLFSVEKELGGATAYLSDTKRRLLLFSRWDQPRKAEVLYRSICIIPFVCILVLFYAFSIPTAVLALFGTENHLLIYISFFLLVGATHYLLLSTPVFYLVKFLLRKKM